MGASEEGEEGVSGWGVFWGGCWLDRRDVMSMVLER